MDYYLVLILYTYYFLDSNFSRTSGLQNISNNFSTQVHFSNLKIEIFFVDFISWTYNFFHRPQTSSIFYCLPGLSFSLNLNFSRTHIPIFLLGLSVFKNSGIQKTSWTYKIFPECIFSTPRTSFFSQLFNPFLLLNIFSRTFFSRGFT